MSTWMVVEDEPDIYELLLAMFEIWGIEGVAFVDGEEAITWIDETDKGAPSDIPELAVLDIRLPGNVSGPMVGQRVRQSPVLNGMAIVLITAYKLTVDEEKAVTEQAGADKILYKPLPKFNELKNILELAISGRKAITEAALQKAEQAEKAEKADKVDKVDQAEKVDKVQKVQKEN